MRYYYTKMDSPIGTLYIVANSEALVLLTQKSEWINLKKRFLDLLVGENKIISTTKTQLNEYFQKKRKIFSVPLDPCGTAFQKSAWSALLDVPYGQTISYSEQAQKIGHPKAVRAIGGANGANPIPIIIPCHRVIGKSGKLTGYASGLDIKSYLLDLENL